MAQTQTTQRIFLVKDGKTQIGVVAQKNKDKVSLNRTILHNGDPGHLKYYPGENYDINRLAAVLNVFDSVSRVRRSPANQCNACIVEFRITYNTFYETFQFHIGLRLGDELKNKLITAVPSPNMCVKGTLLATHLDRQPVEERMEYEFCVSHMNFLDPKRTYLIKDVPALVAICNNATIGVVLQLNYSITLEWKQSGFEMPQKDVNILQKMLEDKLFADCVIVASNKAEVNCHRSVLSAHSDVLHTMLSGGFQESQTGRIEMVDLSEESLNLLISFMYENKLDCERITEEVAFELLNSAQKYNISSLAKTVVTILTSKPNHWFTLSNVLALYFFTGNVWEYQPLCDKMLDILKRNSKELQSTPLFQELEETNPKEARKLAFKLAEL